MIAAADMASLQTLFGLSVSPFELILRGSLVYWGLFLLFRFVLRRDAGSLGIADILLLVLIADASQNAMSGGYQSLSEGALLVATIAGWNWLMDWGAFRFSLVRRLAEPEPLVLVRRGRIIGRNLRREYISTPELMASLREQGIDKLADVKLARMEPDGRISVIRRARDDGTAQAPRDRRPGSA
jgi:uncharacterized membrane protein YcaP (DUF421 family)